MYMYIYMSSANVACSDHAHVHDCITAILVLRLGLLPIKVYVMIITPGKPRIAYVYREI